MAKNTQEVLCPMIQRPPLSSFFVATSLGNPLPQATVVQPHGAGDSAHTETHRKRDRRLPELTRRDRELIFLGLPPVLNPLFQVIHCLWQGFLFLE